MSACKSWQEVEERESIFSQFWNGFSLNIIKARKFSSLARAKKATRSIYEKRRHDGKNNKTTTTTTTTTSLDNWVMQEDIELKRFCYVSLEFETNEEFLSQIITIIYSYDSFAYNWSIVFEDILRCANSWSDKEIDLPRIKKEKSFKFLIHVWHFKIFQKQKSEFMII